MSLSLIHIYRERWDDLINSYFEAPRHHTLLVQLLDCRHAPSADDEQLLRYLHYHQIPYVVALTKACLLYTSADALRQKQHDADVALAEKLQDYVDRNLVRASTCLLYTSRCV